MGDSLKGHEHSGRQAPSHDAECLLTPIDARTGCSAECRPLQRCRLWPNLIHSVRTFDQWQLTRSSISGTRPVSAADRGRCRRPVPRHPLGRLDDRGDAAAPGPSARPGGWAPLSQEHGAALMDAAGFCPPGAWPGGWIRSNRARGRSRESAVPGPLRAFRLAGLDILWISCRQRARRAG